MTPVLGSVRLTESERQSEPEFGFTQTAFLFGLDLMGRLVKWCSIYMNLKPKQEIERAPCCRLAVAAVPVVAGPVRGVHGGARQHERKDADGRGPDPLQVEPGSRPRDQVTRAPETHTSL